MPVTHSEADGNCADQHSKASIDRQVRPELRPGRMRGSGKREHWEVTIRHWSRRLLQLALFVPLLCVFPSPLVGRSSFGLQMNQFLFQFLF